MFNISFINPQHLFPKCHWLISILLCTHQGFFLMTLSCRLCLCKQCCREEQRTQLLLCQLNLPALWPAYKQLYLTVFLFCQILPKLRSMKPRSGLISFNCLPLLSMHQLAYAFKSMTGLEECKTSFKSKQELSGE